MEQIATIKNRRFLASRGVPCYVCVRFALMITVTVLAAYGSGRTLDVYILAGQSNAAGRAPYRELLERHDHLDSVGIPLGQYPEPASEVIYAHREVRFADGTLFYDQRLGELRTKPNTHMGPELALGRDLAHASQNDVVLLKFVSGGSSIEHWLPEAQNLYPELMGFLGEQVALLHQDGSEVNWKGLFWVQGESDSREYRVPAYADRLGQFLTTLRQDLSSPRLPAVMAQVKSNLTSLDSGVLLSTNLHAAQLNQNVVEYVRQDPAFSVTPHSNDLNVRDRVHYHAAAYVELGHRLFDTYRNHFGLNEHTDLNGDGSVDAADMGLMAALWESTVDPDITGDSYMDAADFGALAADWTDRSLPAVLAPPGADRNDDQLVDAADVQLLINQWGRPGPGDANADGISDAADVGLILRHWTRSNLNPDLNQDGRVDAADAGILFATWAQRGSGDLNQDDLVDAADVGILAEGWSDSQPLAAIRLVPEPAFPSSTLWWIAATLAFCGIRYSAIARVEASS